METKTIGFILIGTAVVLGGTVLTVHLIKKGKDKKKAEDAKKASYGASLEQQNPTPQEETPAAVKNTPKPKPKPAPNPTPAPTQTDNSFSYDKTLKSPSTGVVWIEIKALQAYLNTKGYNLAIDGLFGKGTRTAMFGAMGLAYKDTLNITLKAFLDKAASNFKAPMATANKISFADFQAYFSSNTTAQNPDYPYQTPFQVNGFLGLSLFGL